MFRKSALKANRNHYNTHMRSPHMDESEVDQWYQEKKAQLSQRMKEQIMKGTDPQKAKEQFNQDLNKLIKQMQSKQTKAVKEGQQRENDEREEKQAEELLQSAKTDLKLWLERKRGARPGKNE
jgi:hypothetical protein